MSTPKNKTTQNLSDRQADKPERKAESPDSSAANQGATDSSVAGFVEKAKETGSDIVAQAKETGADLAGRAKEAGEGLLTQAKTAAGDAYSNMTEKASAAIDDKKAGIGTEIGKAAEAARRVSEAIQDGDGQSSVTDYAARYAETGARKLEDIAGYFESNDLKAMVRDVEDFGRRNPAVFLGAAFAVGVLAARFIKSSPSASPAARGAAAGGSIGQGSRAALSEL